MRVETAQWLCSAEGAQWLAGDLDPSSLADAQRLRRHLDPDRAAAVLSQIGLRRKAVAKFGAQAQRLFFTPIGLEQASRKSVSQWRAKRFLDEGASAVVDLGCGIGADSLAMIEAGLEVRPVELDQVSAIFAQANLGVEVVVADATTVSIGSDEAIFCDPARRSATGRSWKVSDFSPPWDFVTAVLSHGIVNVKLGPGVPYNLIPDAVSTTWISESGDVVEASLWAPASRSQRSALVLPAGLSFSDGGIDEVITSTHIPTPGEYLIEPDGAIIRAGLVDLLAAQLGATRIHRDIAYLTSPTEVAASPAYARFRVSEVMPYHQKTLKAWVRNHSIGVLEIKKRGLELDPAVLRTQLRPRGDGSATLVITPTALGAVVCVVERF